MHEIGIARQIVRVVEEAVRGREAPAVREVVVDCGELSLVIPQYLEKLWPVVTKGGFLQEARLVIHTVPGLAECDNCDEIFNVVAQEGRCPNCGSFQKTVLSGKDFSVREIHTDAP